jgi:hypothetical protein
VVHGLGSDKQTHGCSKCVRLFPTLKKLNLHMEVHERPHDCEICDGAFRSKPELDKHIRAHRCVCICGFMCVRGCVCGLLDV